MPCGQSWGLALVGAHRVRLALSYDPRVTALRGARMDISTINAGMAALTGSFAAAKTALEIRDFNAAGTAVAEATQKLLDVQGQLLSINGAFMQLQQQHAAMAQKVRELEEQRAQRERYALVELSPGVMVYRVNERPQAAGADSPGVPEPVHHLCPQCFHRGHTSILQKISKVGTLTLDCSACEARYPTGEVVRINRPRPRMHRSPIDF